MNKSEKQAELTALKDSFESGSIDSTQYTDGIIHIMNLPENAPFSATKNLGLEIFEKLQLIKVGKCSIPFDRLDRSRKLRVATMLKDNPEEEKKQRQFYNEN